jgi:lipopolysaccharide heptosyltransferase II
MRMTPERILIIRLSSMGDVILATPIFRQLRWRFPNAVIDLVIKSKFSELLETDPNLDHVITFEHTQGYSALVELRNLLAQQKYDLCIDLHRNLRSVYLRRIVPRRQRLLYARRRFRRWLYVHFRWNLFKSTPHVMDDYAAALKPLQITDDNLGPQLTISGDKHETARNLLRQRGVPAGVSYIVMAPGAGTATKCWTVDGFIECGRHLVAQDNCCLVIIGGMNDVARCREIAEGIGETAVTVAGELSWSGTASVVQDADGVICNDSWILHAAAAFNKKTVAVFGPTTAEMGYYPWSDQVEVVERAENCRPCSHTGNARCPKSHFRCMADISGAQVYHICKRHLLNINAADQ